MHNTYLEVYVYIISLGWVFILKILRGGQIFSSMGGHLQNSNFDEGGMNFGGQPFQKK